MLAGFLGTLLVIQPSFREVGATAFLPVLTAILISFFILFTRHIAKKTDPIGLQAANGVMAMVLIAPAVFLVPTESEEIKAIAMNIAHYGNDMLLLLTFVLVGTAAT